MEKKVWGVTNLGGKNFIWHAYGAKRYARLPFFLDKKSAIAEKARQDVENPAPNPDFQRKVVSVVIKW